METLEIYGIDSDGKEGVIIHDVCPSVVFSNR